MYECPSCGAGLIFNPATQKLKCYYCNQEFEIKEIERVHLKKAKGEKSTYQENNNNEKVQFNKEEQSNEEVTENNNQQIEENVYEAIIYRCTQCGAELITTDETISTFCSYCGSSALLERKDTKKKKPDYIIPFTKTKEECERAYKKKLSSALFAPRNMAEEQQIEKIRGIYMPYWIYSFKKDGQDISMGQQYKGRRGDYVIYKDFEIKTNVKAGFSGITHDASANFSDSLSEAIAPFSMKEKKEFSPTYLSGFYADAEDVNNSVYMEESNKIAGAEISKELMKDKVYSKYNAKAHVILQPSSVELGLFPVYFLATKNKTEDRISYAVVNGQTGKVAAEIPIDFKKYIIISLILAIPIFLLLNAMATVTPIKVLIISIIFSIISMTIIGTQYNQIEKREKKLDDRGFTSKENITVKKEKKKRDPLATIYIVLFVIPMVTMIAFPILILMGKTAIKFLFFASIVAITVILKKKCFNRKHEEKTEKGKKMKKLTKLIKPILGLIISAIILILNPVSDLYCYAGAAVSIFMVIWSFADIIKGLNLLTTRKLPQLEKRGGDENE